MKKDALIKYCEEKEIWLPKGATLPVITNTYTQNEDCVDCGFSKTYRSRK